MYVYVYINLNTKIYVCFIGATSYVGKYPNSIPLQTEVSAAARGTESKQSSTRAGCHKLSSTRNRGLHEMQTLNPKMLASF